MSASPFTKNIHEFIPLHSEAQDYDERPAKVPICINPEADILYRGLAACEKGDVFHARCKEWWAETEPVCGTRILAVDAITLTSERPTRIAKILRSGFTSISEQMNRYFGPGQDTHSDTHSKRFS